jgi:hypothetical protein
VKKARRSAAAPGGGGGGGFAGGARGGRGGSMVAAPRPLRYADLGGIEEVLADIRETIEYPLKHPEARWAFWGVAEGAVGGGEALGGGKLGATGGRRGRRRPAPCHDRRPVPCRESAPPAQPPARLPATPAPHQVYAWLGVEPPRGVLLHGPPGCGKTALAHAIANECSVPFLRVSAPEVVSGMSGESEAKLRQLFQVCWEGARERCGRRGAVAARSSVPSKLQRPSTPPRAAPCPR